MISNTSRAPTRILYLLGLATAVLIAPTGARPAHADGADHHVSVTGVYAVAVTLRDCTSGAPLGPASDSLVTLHAGGTITESAGGRAFAPGQRSTGHGSWRQIGRRTYSQEMIALIVFDTPANLPGTPTFDPTRPVSPGFQAGWQTISHTITFSDPTHAASTGTNALVTFGGVTYRTGCSTAVLERVAAP